MTYKYPHKPKIKLAQPNFHKTKYICFGPVYVGYGNTPGLAYKNYLIKRQAQQDYNTQVANIKLTEENKYNPPLGI